jgi:SAM-dependent methyltransferase
MPSKRERIRAHEYELGHSDWELKRLQTQARLVDPFTRRYFLEAGLMPEMRVLDIGSGAGDVSLLAAAIVGETGEVVGIDRSPAAVAAAAARIDGLGLRNVSFLVGEPRQVAFDRPFDAVVGRYVLMFTADPVDMLRACASHVRSGGIVAFHEPDWRSCGSDPPAPLFDSCCRSIVRTFEEVGTDPYCGRALHATFVRAGLPAPTMAQSALIGGAANPVSGIDMLADLAITLAPVMEQHGVIAPGEIDPATYRQRVVEEAERLKSVVMGRSEVGAWSRVA